MAGFAVLGTTEPDFYRGSATGIPWNNNIRTSVRKESCEFFVEINRKAYEKEPSGGLLR